MKNLFKLHLIFLLVAVIFYSCAGPSQPTGLVEKTFKVWGNCEQCKATIEAAGKMNGVDAINWNEDTKLLKFKMDTSKVSENLVLKAIAESGYDNERFTASDKAYSELPECCQYKRKPRLN